jgi:hypothetical protein
MSPKAILWREFREDYPDGTFVELIIWLVPISIERPHGLKYRLYFGTNNGTCILRYDNEKGKSDHSHMGTREESYLFISPEKLLLDFWNDVAKYRKELL